MKKITAIILVLTMALALAACGKDNTEATTTTPVETTTVPEGTDDEIDPPPATSDIMSYSEYVDAELDTAVCVETFVQATQSWWDDTITVYSQDYDGAYFIYGMACSEEDAAKLVPGTKIRVSGYKGEFNGEIEILDATFEFVEDGESYIAPALDVTDMLGTGDLITYQNMYVALNGLTVSAVSFKGGEPGDDIYVTATVGEVTVDLCVEVYLTGTETEVYSTVSALEEGDVIDVECFLYWYENANPHITSVTVVE